MAVKHTFRIIFMNQSKVYEIYAHNVSQGSILGFIEVEKLIFGGRSAVVVDPGEERLKTEFQDVKRIYIPMHAIIRIDEVAREGVAKISNVDGNVARFPYAPYPPGGGSNQPS